MRQLTRATSPVWYTACFSKTYANPTLWSHYADNQKGICLVFGPDEDKDGASLVLHPPHIDNDDEEFIDRQEPISSRFYFQTVRYVKTLDDVEFFERIGELPEKSVRAVWFTGADGSTSSAATHLTAEADIEQWRAATWSELSRDICTKTDAWQHEQEVRLVNFNESGSLLPDQEQRWSYEFSALKSIIFGVTTPDHQKLEIIESIRRQCQDVGRTEFDFRQAYNSTQGEGLESFSLNIDLTCV